MKKIYLVIAVSLTNGKCGSISAFKNLSDAQEYAAMQNSYHLMYSFIIEEHTLK